MRYDDAALLKIVGEECKRSIGFGEGDSGELSRVREKALAYYKGEMQDVPSLPNRSRAVDTTVADAVETVLPDVMEVFVGGEDVATFIPQGEGDEDAAQEETDFVQHVVFTENEGFLTLYSAFKDALLTRTGVIGWWWEEEEVTETVAQPPEELVEAVQAVAALEGEQLEAEEQEDGSVALTSKHLHGKVKIKAFPSEDFTVAVDTVSLKDATYCAVRDRVRVQELIARGIDAEKARALPPYVDRTDAIEQERDRADEHSTPDDGTLGDLKMVEVRAHYIRLDMDDDGKLEIWRVVTDAQERVLLEKEQVDQIPFAALTPYIIPHRFYGESVADKLMEVQRIKTALLRMLLDSGYFALNQRMEVSMAKANDFTIADLLRNEPNVPVRVAQDGAVRPISAGGLNFDAFAALEYAATMAEGRSGIVRNAQGLNPDTLHDTAKGAMALISAAQKRVRMIARIFAETGVKDLFLGVHCLLRRGYTEKHQPASVKLRNAWKTINPGQWNERCAMAVHVGVGSAGREHDIMVANQRLELMAQLIQVPGAQGTLIDGKNIHQGLIAWERAAGTKNPDSYWSDPAQAPPQEPKPDPEVEKAKAELALKREEASAKVQMEREKGAAQVETDAMRAQNDHALAMARMEGEMALKREQIAAELALKREQLAAELELKRELGFAQAQVARETGMAKVQASSVTTSDVEPGGDAG